MRQALFRRLGRCRCSRYLSPVTFLSESPLFRDRGNIANPSPGGPGILPDANKTEHAQTTEPKDSCKHSPLATKHH